MSRRTGAPPPRAGAGGGGSSSTSAPGPSVAVPRTLDEVSALVQTLRNKNSNIEAVIDYLGTVKDTPALRDRLMKDRREAEDISHAVTKAFQTTVKPEGREDWRHRKVMESYRNELTRLKSAVTRSIQRERKTEALASAASGAPAAAGAGAERRPGRAGRGQLVDIGQEIATGGGGGDVESGPSPFARQQGQQVRARDRVDMTTVETQSAVEQERLSELNELERDFEQLYELFEDLQTEVTSQSANVQLLADNVQSAVKDTDVGVVELGKAREYQKKSRTKMCLIICCIAIIVIIALSTGLGFGLR